MKAIKLLLFLTVFSTVIFYSCSDSDPIKNNNTGVPQSSIALRTALNEMKKANQISGKPATQNKTTINPFCFDFVYPLTVSLSNNTVITVSSIGGLLDVLGSESPSLYVQGIVFPFQVTYGGAVHTILGEGQFIALIQYCGFHSLNLDLSQSNCFEIIYPITIYEDLDNGIDIHSNAELQAYIDQSNGFGVAISYPISVNYNGQVVVIHNIYEMYQMINNCDICICTLEYAPVCVHTPNGTIEFSNMCFAECAGFTQNDLVPCNPNTDCNISNETVTVGACNTDGTYSLTVNFSYVNPTDNHFSILTSGGILVGDYPLSALPLTIYHYPLATSTIDNLHIQIANCTGAVSWTTPACGCICPTNVDPVCVQTANGIVTYNNSCLAQCAGFSPNDFITCGVVPNNFGTQLGSCFTMNYPVGVQYQGQIVPAHNDGELLQYWFPAVSSVPSMVYPITAVFGNHIMTFDNQAAFQAQIANSCN